MLTLEGIGYRYAGYAKPVLHDIDLTRSYAYADSHSDLPMLGTVGKPVAVRPDVTLYRHARRHRWEIVDWSSPDATGRTLNPAGAMR